ncbi:MAG: NAD(P)/FAD-dependent oxidoreductase, partial [Desulfobacterales bacterium]|nr:NAD(P)/FAD-dependent oxidoreductase [Desulfobacterales bacterium]
MSETKPLPAGAILQRDKETYGVRITPPSGVVTPDDLEKMAALAREFDIPEVKITSGQRIGFYGISEQNIHDFCERMPFRTGGHYVQACPGTEWCGFAQQDAIGLAGQIEEKFGFAPTPGKIKMGISACKLSCAESYIRDIGFIGSPKGWTMIVGGNAGKTPRIGDVLATELTTEEAFDLFSRFLDWYCENGGKKQRTARLIEKTGID